MNQRQTMSRKGMSLMEVMVALVLFGLVIAAALQFQVGQSKGFRVMAARAEQVQNGRFGRDVMRQEIRSAGTGVTNVQPLVVYASDSVFAFNADLLTNRADSVQFTGAIYVDPYATDAEVSAFPQSLARAIPGSSFNYPSSEYTQIAGTAGEAETIVFRFKRDPNGTSPLDHVLVRYVNGGEEEVIATGLRKVSGKPFFRYWYDPTRYNPSATWLDTVPRTWLPLAKTAALRGVIPDTGTAVSARIDQLRAVEVTYQAARGTSGTGETVTYMIPMPNTAVSRQARACGRPPLSPSSPSASWNNDSLAVMLSWPRATDDGGGEEDVVRYVLFRRIWGTSNWGPPLSTVGVSGSTLVYRYKDSGVESNKRYQYGLAVQDCTPNISGLAATGQIIVPNH